MADNKTVSKTVKKDGKKDVSKASGFRKIWKYLRECRIEIKKISWPTPVQTTKNFGVVLLVMVILGVFVFALDQGLFTLLGLIMKTSAA